jgi:hypothetical protein
VLQGRGGDLLSYYIIALKREKKEKVNRSKGGPKTHSIKWRL